MANRYWVGGTGNWDGSDTSHWATASGGASGASVPTSADDVFFDSGSGAGTVTITGVTANALSITMTQAGITLLHNAGSTVAAAGAVTFTAGAINTNGQTCSWGRFTSTGTGSRTLTLGASSITITGTNAAPWNFQGSNVTFNAGTSTITTTYSFPNLTLGGFTYYNFSVTGLSGGSVTGSLAGGGVFNNLTITNGASKSLIQINSGTYTVNGTLTITGNSTVNRISLCVSAPGTPTIMNAAAVSLANVDFQDITAGGAAAPFTGTSLGDALGNTNITFDAPTTQTWQGASGGNWSDVTKWTSRVPLAQDDVIVSAAFSASQTITLDMRNLGRNIDFSGATGGVSLTLTSYPRLMGDLTLGAGVNSNINSNFQTITLMGRGSHTITCAGCSFSAGAGTGFIIAAPGGTYTMLDNLVMGTGFNVVAGTFNANNYNVTMFNFASTGSIARTIAMGSGTWSVAGVNASANWVISGTNVNVLASASTVAFTNVATLTRVFAGGGAAYNVLTYTVAGSTGTLLIQGSNTFHTINFSDASNARTLQFTSGTTTTITGSFNVFGTAGKLVTVSATTPGSAATLTKTSGTVSGDYLSIQDSTATGGAAWYAGSSSVNVSGNTGWIFSGPQNGWFSIL